MKFQVIELVNVNMIMYTNHHDILIEIQTEIFWLIENKTK